MKYKWKGEKMNLTSKPVRSSTRVSVQRKEVTLTRNQDTSTPRNLSRRSRTSKATTMNTSARMKRKRILDKLDDDDSLKESCTSVESENNIENNNKKPKKANKKSPNKTLNLLFHIVLILFWPLRNLRSFDISLNRDK